MIEQALQTVKTPGIPVSQAGPDRKDNVSAYEKIKAKRAQDKQTEEHGPKFTIDRQFSSSSKVLAKSLGRFNKVLNYLETSVPSKPAEETTMFAGLKISKKRTEPTNNGIENKSQPPDSSQEKTRENKIYGKQLELDLFPNEKKLEVSENQKPPVEVKKFDEPPQKSLEIEQVPSIDVGHNPTDFKIHNIITDEIIKAISQSEPSIKVKDVSEHLASKLANEVRKQLANLPHAIATNEDSAPVTVFDKEI
ncbi:MAG: hypothetical protein DHS20C07_25690 [Methyloligella sp.]|nr:MAG: hypothetical protein DHS20C07_25690 [Methyloligella sp.]